MIAQEQLLTPNMMVPGTRSTYRILKLVGRGGMGAVYRAERTADSTIWALKEMRPSPTTPPDEIEENRNLFEQEAKLLASLSHPNIPVLADYFTFDGRPVMVMEFIEGETLEDRMLQTNAPFPEQQALGFGIQLCRVLHYLHTQQPPIIYRDLKPPNIMVTRANGVMKLIDFGVARTHKKGKSKDTIAMGSAGYAPPEQYGRGQTDARSDVYALGATLLHLLTNLPPVPLQTPAVGYIGRFNPSVSSNTEQVIIKAMDLEREKRFGSCAEMERALLACLTAPYVDPTEQIAIPPVVPPTPHVPAAPAAPVPPVPVAAPAPAAPVPPAAPPPAPMSSVPVAPVIPDAPVAPAPSVVPGSIACDNCGYINKPNARFCANCGSPLQRAQIRPPARLNIRSPRGTWRVAIGEQTLPCRIGRRDPSQGHYPEVDLAEHDRGISSRHHALIQRDGNDGYAIVDLGSTNGTFVNGTRLAPSVPRRLYAGDKIKIGEVEMEFRWDQ